MQDSKRSTGPGATYAESGVDIAAGNKAVDLIKKKVEATFSNLKNGKVITGIGGFSGIVRMPNGQYIASTTDGVGTKLLLAILLNEHDTVGIDLVAMCVNDLVMTGIIPGVFTDYIAMGKQDPQRTGLIISGIIEGCNQAECALIGGEMAELPGMYGEDVYDLAGFAIGFADSEKDLILGKEIEQDMWVYGLPSNGIHSNGYSMVRKIFGIYLEVPRTSKRILMTCCPELNGQYLGSELLRPTKIYVKKIIQLMKEHEIVGMANITGGGLIENPPRFLPDNCAIEFFENTWEVPPIFELIRKLGSVKDEEMYRTFNNGIGAVLVSPDEIKKEGVIKIGRVISGNKEVIFSFNGKNRLTFSPKN